MPRWFIVRLFLVAMLGLLIMTTGGLTTPHPRTAQAQTPLELVLQRVLDYLEEQIGRSVTLVRYDYAVRTWEDGGLGCPQEGYTYPAGPVTGYEWLITIDGDQKLQIHSDLDGLQITICTPVDRAALMKYRNFQTADFVIDHPQSWQAFGATPNYAAIFVPSPEVVCGDPGMMILEITGQVNADSMINEAILRAGFVQNLGISTPIAGGKALTVTYQTICNEFTIGYRTSAYPNEDGQGGYLIQQWAVVTDFPSWDAVYLKILSTFQRIDELLTNAQGTPVVITNAEPNNNSSDGTGPATASLDPTQLLGGFVLAHNFVDELYLSAMNDLPGVRLTRSDGQRRGLAFSADGQYLAYIEPASQGERLEVVQGIQRPAPISDNIAPGYPVSWHPTQNRLAYVRLGADGASYEIHTALPDGTEQTLVGSFPTPTACETTPPPTLSEKLYWAETAPLGNGYLFAWLADGRFLLTSDCAGVGVAMWSAETGLTPLTGANDSPLRKAVLSPDKSRIAALNGENELVVVNITDGTSRPFPLDVLPDQLAWNFDGSQVYFSHLQEANVLTVEDTSFASRGERLLGQYPYTSVVNTVAIYVMNVGTGEAILLWQTEGYAVGRLIPAPNGAGVVFSFVPSDRKFIEGFRQNLTLEELRFLAPETQILWLPPNGGQATLLMYSQYPLLSPVAVSLP